jgi:hypothetical protein
MVPNRGGKFLFTYFTTTARKLDSFVCVEYLVKGCNVAFVPFVEPTRPGLKVQNLFAFYLYMT